MSTFYLLGCAKFYQYFVNLSALDVFCRGCVGDQPHTLEHICPDMF